MNGNFFMKCVRYFNKKSSNKGSSVILVIVSIAFVSMLVAITAHMSYYNFAMRDTDRSSKANFYSAEEALAEIKLGLEADVSNAMAIAYTYALEQSTDVDMDAREFVFENRYREELVKALRVSDDDDTKYNITKLESYLVKTGLNLATNVGAEITTNPSANENKIFLKEDGGISLQKVRVKYTDARGFVSIIQTDIWLQNPKISLATRPGVPDLENCAIIANDQLIVEGNNMKMSGNVYGGNNGTIVQNPANLRLEKRDTDAASTMYKFVTDNLLVRNTTGSTYGFDMSDNYQLYTNDIVVDSGKLALGGESFIQDDLTIEGKDSFVSLTGDYYGYGNQAYQSKNSSSILVNGAETILDLANIRSLMLSGHAYIAARHYDAELEDDDYVADPDAVEEPDPADPPVTRTYDKNERDILMGESLGVKSNQLMYLVPRECMGYYYGTSEQYLAKNPLSYSEYQLLTQTYQVELNADGTEKKDASGNPVYVLDSLGNKILKYDVVNTDAIMERTGKSLMSLGASYVPVFRRVNGSVLVYYYLNFASEDFANEFFKLYYENNRDEVEEYVKTYIKQIRVNDALTSTLTESNLRLAGNIVKFDDDDRVVLVEDTTDVDTRNAEVLAANRDRWQDAYIGYSKKMLPSSDNLGSAINNTIYENIIDMAQQTVLGMPSGTICKFYLGDEVSALFINNSSQITLNSSNVPDSVSIIVTSGDAVLEKNQYKGLIICGGVLKVASSCDHVECAPAAVRKAMNALYDKTQKKEFYNLFKDGSFYQVAESAESIGSGAATEEEQKIERAEQVVQIGDKIVYENWTKQ